MKLGGVSLGEILQHRHRSSLAGLQKFENIAEFWGILEAMRKACPTSPVLKRRRQGMGQSQAPLH